MAQQFRPKSKTRKGEASLIAADIDVTQKEHELPEVDRPVVEWSSQSRQRGWRLFNGPAKESLRLLPKDSVDCIVTSPPYFWLRDYKVDGQVGLEDSVDGYVVNVTDALTEAYRVLKPTGVLFLNIGDTYYSGKGESQGKDKKSAKRRFGLRAVDRGGGLGIGLQRKSIIGVPWRVALKMCQQNWILRSPIVWNRTNCLPEPVKDRPSRGYEFVFMFAKSRFYHFNRNGLRVRENDSEDVWNIAARPKQNGGLDTAPYPDELVERCLAIGCPERGTVLDPFAGSGTTMRVAIKSGRHAIGVELNREFCDYIVQNLNHGKL